MVFSCFFCVIFKFSFLKYSRIGFFFLSRVAFVLRKTAFFRQDFLGVENQISTINTNRGDGQYAKGKSGAERMGQSFPPRRREKILQTRVKSGIKSTQKRTRLFSVRLLGWLRRSKSVESTHFLWKFCGEKRRNNFGGINYFRLVSSDTNGRVLEKTNPLFLLCLKRMINFDNGRKFHTHFVICKWF